MSKVLIICGGTGGHLTPGIAVAEELLERKHKCVLIVSRKKVDARLIKKYPDLEFIDAPGAPFSFRPLALVKFICAQTMAFLFALKILWREKPDLMLGFGGFLSAGFALPGTVLGIPFVLHEANRVVGRSNRILSRIARRVFLPPELKYSGVSNDKISYAGLPLRKEFQGMDKQDALSNLGFPNANKLLVIMGGSQGAECLNNWALEHAEALAGKGISLYCLTGQNKNDVEQLSFKTDAYGEVDSRFVSFSDDIPSVLSAADLVVSRAGAGSIAEIIRCGIPSILIPYPFARDNHQWANAKYLQDRSGAVVIDQSKLDSLYAVVEELLSSDQLLANYQRELKSLDRPAEAQVLVNELEALMGAKSICKTSVDTVDNP